MTPQVRLKSACHLILRKNICQDNDYCRFVHFFASLAVNLPCTFFPVRPAVPVFFSVLPECITAVMCRWGAPIKPSLSTEQSSLSPKHSLFSLRNAAFSLSAAQPSLFPQRSLLCLRSAAFSLSPQLSLRSLRSTAFSLAKPQTVV